MKELRERIDVAAPVELTEAGLMAFFDVRQDANGVTRMRLRVVLDGSHVAIEREVRVTARAGRDDEGLNDLVRITWQPEGTVVFPQFEGTLVAWGGEDPASSVIELRGHYAPPLGAAGQVFDEAIGLRIAQATAHEFLRDIKREIESRAKFTKRAPNGE
ncbi:MAG TPA: hypothetical protein VMF11_01295 [Candidatus Baltobacteraceae bacterium]|nr:hypothetical protein [Candidatus Baltobacteraceae bacterium]